MEHREIKGENMEMRLIDANMMAVEESEAYISAQTSGKINPITQGVNSVVHRKIQQLIADTPTVDPETLPIVQKLRKELARVTAERDAAFCLCGKLIALCSPPKEWAPKLFRRHINRPGDYMGSGYDFLDSFNRIFDNFVETADDEFYTAICGAAKKEILERKQKIAGKKEE